MSDRIDVMKPWLGDEEVAAVAEVISSGWVAQGPKTAEFERAFAKRQEAAHGVAVSSCTAALHLALVVAGIKPGDDVVVPSFSFVATANAPTYVGARPVFADVDSETGNVTAETVAAVLTPSTRAVIAVDQGGMPVDLDPLRALCEKRNIVLIEDAACGVGSTYRGAPVGTGADITAWSFHPRKILTTGEGGMLTTDRSDWAERARRLREHAMDASAAERHRTLLAPRENYAEIGFNYRMTDVQAAIGLVQLGRLDDMIARRRALVGVYRHALADVDGLRLSEDPDWGTSNFQSFWIDVLPSFPIDREDLLARFAWAGISARRGIMAAHLQPAHRGSPLSLPVTERLTDSTLILPLHHSLDPESMARIISVICKAAGKSSAPILNCPVYSARAVS